MSTGDVHVGKSYRVSRNAVSGPKPVDYYAIIYTANSIRDGRVRRLPCEQQSGRGAQSPGPQLSAFSSPAQVAP
jgi:hypothetical protein